MMMSTSLSSSSNVRVRKAKRLTSCGVRFNAEKYSAISSLFTVISASF